MNRDRSAPMPGDRNPSATEYDDITWHDAWDAGDVVDELDKLSNRFARSGEYITASLLSMVISYILEKEEEA